MTSPIGGSAGGGGGNELPDGNNDGLPDLNTISGNGVPDPSLGEDGNYYIDSVAGTVYGPKTGGSWGSSSPLGTAGPPGNDGADGADGTNGTDGDDGLDGADGKTVLNGSGAPASGLGTDGDFYIDTTAMEIYGPKTGGTNWGTGTSLVGAAGQDGSDGQDGADGNDGAPGPQGPAGGGLKVSHSFCGDNEAYVRQNSKSYRVAARFYFPGTGVIGVPSFCKVQYSVNNSHTAKIRVWDRTNDCLICEATGLNPAVEDEHEEADLGTLTNLPAARALFELQLAVSSSGSGRRTECSALIMD